MSNNHDHNEEFHIGPFSVGDLIAVAGVIFVSGSMWYRVTVLENDNKRHQDEHLVALQAMDGRVRRLESVMPSEYVQRKEYREDIRDLKALLERIESKVDRKVDR